MQTFVPYPDAAKSMAVQDNSRLGNQVYREGITLLRGGWPNHPAAKMWKGYEQALCYYLLAGVQELSKRNNKSYLDRPWCLELYKFWNTDHDNPWPTWWGDDRVHSSHRANLLRKDPVHYGQFGWTEAPQEGYYWPSNEESKDVQATESGLQTVRILCATDSSTS